MTPPRSRCMLTITSLLMIAALGLLSGCHSTLFRGQSPDADPVFDDDNPASTVGDLTIPSGLGFEVVQGVALVLGLNDTGSDPRPGAERENLLSDMAAEDTEDPQTILSSKKTALVIVRGFLPPGIREGQRFDVAISVPRRSEVTSLRGGWMMPCRMREVARLNNAVRQGHVDAAAAGNVLVDAVFDDSDDPNLAVSGRILGGGVAHRNRDLGLIIRENSASIYASTLISSAINNRFYHYVQGERKGVAEPKNATYIELKIPPRYTHNISRYVRVVQSIPLRQSPAERAVRMQELERELLEPTSAARAALQLEAMGTESIDVLRRGMASFDQEVRFYSAEALTYLGDETAAPMLAEAAANERAFRWHALTALSVSDHLTAYEALSGLLKVDSAETRFGAFRAMRARNPRDPLVRGEILKEVLALHELPVEGEPMVHFSNSRRPEVVLFGSQQRLINPDFLFVGRRLMIKALDEDNVRVIRFTPGQDEEVVVCPNRLGDIIRAIVDLGGGYEEVYQACRSAQVAGNLEGRLVVDARARQDRTFRRDVEETSPYRVAGPLPTLFNDGPAESPDRDASFDYPDQDWEEGESSRGFFDKMKFWKSSDN